MTSNIDSLMALDASVVDTPKPNTLGTVDFEYFLSKIVSVFLRITGEFDVVEGVSVENPTEPKEIEGTMKIATAFVPAYTFRPTDINITRERNQRFTMKDIGKLQKEFKILNIIQVLPCLKEMQNHLKSLMQMDLIDLSLVLLLITLQVTESVT